MEPHNNGDQTQNQLTNYSRNRKPSQSQVIIDSTDSRTTNPISELSSVLGFVLLANTFTYDISNLPDSLLLEIISRLPLKSIFKFKCVCKHWQTLISQPSLPRLYRSRTVASVSPFNILYKYIYVSEFKDILDRFRPEIYNLPNVSVLFLSKVEDHQQTDQFKVLGVSNGLLLLCMLVPLTYYVLDPVTRQCVTLPMPIPDDTQNRLFLLEGFVTKVNQDNVVTSFKVVRVGIGHPEKHLFLQVFSSETGGNWVDYKLPCDNLIILVRRSGGPIMYNGIMHWAVNDYGMVAFDPFKNPKSCRLIQFPEGRDVQSEVKNAGLFRLCDVSQGKFRFFEVAEYHDSFYCFRMWEMEDYAKGQWRSEFEVTRNDLSSSDPELSGVLTEATFIPLCFHPFNLDVVYLRCAQLACVVAYSIENRSLDVVVRHIGAVDDLSWRVVVPFVTPWWPTPVPFRPVPKKAVRIPSHYLFKKFHLV